MSKSACLEEFLRTRDFLLRYRTDYDTAVREFHWPAFDRFNWALDYFDAIAAGNDQPALHIVDEDGTEHLRSFAELSAQSDRVANFLRSLGVRRGDRLLLMLGNQVALWETLLAAIKLGAVVVPATELLAISDLQDRFARGGIRHVVTATRHTGKFDLLPLEGARIGVGGATPGWNCFEDATEASPDFVPDGDTNANDPLLLYFTSGTTSLPKLVLHSHQSYPVGHLSTMYWIGLQPGDVHWNISSPGWAKHAWSCLFAPWNAGATVFIYNYSRFQPKAVLDTLVRHEVTTLCAPPTVWRMLIQEPLAKYQIKLREVLAAGEPLNPEVIERVKAAWGLTIRDGYGQTETTAQIGNSPGQPLKLGSMGRPLPGYHIRLAQLDSEDDGEICIDLHQRPVGLMLQYSEQAGPTTRDKGFYHTGDVARRDSDGFITFIGRIDDVFKASDYRISPFELESVLIRHPAIAEAAVIPSPDPVRHSVPKAFVLLAPGYVASRELAREIFQFAHKDLASYKRIRRLEFGELPKTISGKIRRAQLRTLERERRDSNSRAELEFFADDF